METNIAAATVITPEGFLNLWQGHRGLTRRVIEAFPEKELFSFSIGGMRTFAVLAMEMTDLANPGIEGLVTGEWKDINSLPHSSGEGMPETKEELLALWDETTLKIDRLWEKLEDFTKETLAFGAFPGTVSSTIQYFIDNEIHHRGQGYVYLRALGIEPPAFWDR
jgi:uncharacterized damage-inducible protein DinB